MSNLVLRVLSAVVLLPLVIALVLWDVRWGFAGLVLLVTALALREWAAMALRGRPIAEHAVPVGLGTALAVALYLVPQLALVAVLATVMLTLAMQLSFAGEIASATHRLSVSLAGVFYVPPLVVALPLLQRDVVGGESWVLLAMGLTFSADTGAYFAGRAFGRRKLAPKISPGKTWEGVAGGLLGALGFGFLARATFFPALSAGDCVVTGLATGFLGPVGDLVESLVKRSCGVKDSGNLIPGHGGILDRIDALLFVGAFVYFYAAHLR